MFIRKKNIERLTDEQIIVEYQKSFNNKYIGVLYERYYHTVFGVCLKYLKSVENSEDAVVFIFEKLLKDLVKSNVNNFQGWLYMVTKNFCLQQLRKKKYTTVEYSHFEAILKSAEDTVIDKINEETLFQRLEDSIEILKEEQRVCIKLFYLHKNSYAEVASLTGYDVKQVKSHIQNGKRKLGILLQNDYQLLIGQK